MIFHWSLIYNISTFIIFKLRTQSKTRTLDPNTSDWLLDLIIWDSKSKIYKIRKLWGITKVLTVFRQWNNIFAKKNMSAITQLSLNPLGSEAATGGVLLKKVFLEISQNSQEKTCARDSFLIVFSREFCEISKNTFFNRTPPDECFCGMQDKCLTISWQTCSHFAKMLFHCRKARSTFLTLRNFRIL